MRDGVEKPYKGVNSKIMKIKGEEVQVVYKVLSDGTKVISNAWVIK